MAKRTIKTTERKPTVPREKIKKIINEIAEKKKSIKKKPTKKKHNKKISKKEQMVKKYADVCAKLKRYPTMNEFTDMSVYTKDMVSHHHGSLGRLKVAARKKFPKNFKSILDDSIFNPKAIQRLRTKIKDAKRFIVTTAVSGCSVDANFLASIQNYSKIHNAELLVLVASDPAASVNKFGFVDPKIPIENIVVANVSLNSNIHINTIKLSAKHIDPITSLTRIGQRDGTFIYASPKQRLKFVATGNNRSTHAVMTTGAITLPNYVSERYMSDRTAVIAEHDHIMGAIIVEIEDDKIYHFRQIQADKDGNFIDIGKEYSSEAVADIEPAAFVLGDWHSGSTNDTVVQCWKEMTKLLKPKRLILHDLFDGLSINHHEEHNIILRSQRAQKGHLNLRDEFVNMVKDLNDLTKWNSEEIVVVKSNHDEFLESYLCECKYANDAYNHRFSLDLARAFLDGHDPIKFGCEQLGLKRGEKIRWLRRDDDYVIARIQLGAHGDKGANGARGSTRGMENAYGQSVTAHTHSPEILRGAWVVGTSTRLKLSYNQGPSSWAHTSCIVYPNGSRQLINVIKGKWRIK